jgi:hypothetical protein
VSVIKAGGSRRSANPFLGPRNGLRVVPVVSRPLLAFGETAKTSRSVGVRTMKLRAARLSPRLTLEAQVARRGALPRPLRRVPSATR